MCMELLVIEWSHRAPGHGMVGTVLCALSVLTLSPPQASLVIGTIIMAVLPTEVQRPSCGQAYWGRNCRINPDPGILAPVHTLNYDTSIHVAFQNRKIFFFF